MPASAKKKNASSSANKPTKTSSSPKKHSWGRRLTKSTGVILNIILVGVTCLCWLGTQFSPSHMAWLAPLGIGWPVLVVCNLLCILVWALHKDKWFALSLGVMLLLLGDVKRTCNIPPIWQKADTIARTEVKMMSFNVATFNTFKKENNEVLSYIIQEDPDIICMQEFVSHSKKNYLNVNNIIDTMKDYPYHYITYTSTGARNFGIATFSKYPITQKQKIWFSDTYNSAHYCDIAIASDTIRVFNCHLQSNSFNPHDFNQFSNASTKDELQNVAGLFGSKLLRGYRMRGEQVDAVALETRLSPHKKIVCGDFNDVPMSYSYKTLADGLVDAHDNCCWGPGYTFHKRWLGLRIDYILHSPELHSKGFQIGQKGLSDHCAIKCVIGI